VIVLTLAAAGASKSGAPAVWVSWVKTALVDGEPQMPNWMATINKIAPVAALGRAASLTDASPKNLLLAVGGAAAIIQTKIPGAEITSHQETRATRPPPRLINDHIRDRVFQCSTRLRGGCGRQREGDLQVMLSWSRTATSSTPVSDRHDGGEARR
jgi:hypothetical protein